MKIRVCVQKLCKCAACILIFSLFLGVSIASIKQYRGTTWRAIVRRAGHPTQSKTFDTKRDAERWASVIEGKLGVVLGSTNRVNESKAAVVTLFERYLREVIPTMRGKNAAGIIKRLIRDAKFLSKPLNQLTPEMIRDWRDERVKQIKPASVHRELNSMSSVFTHAMKEWSTPLLVNPCSLVTRFKNADKQRDRRWSAKDIATLLKSIDWKETHIPVTGRDYVGWAFLLAIETAMRAGELCGMRVKDFHVDESYVHLELTKNDDSRDVPLSTTARRYLVHLCAGKNPDDKIIPLIANTLCEYFGDARNAAGLHGLVFHDTRHEAATRLSKKLTNVLELSAVTGHRSLKSLKRYYNPTPQELTSKLG